MRSGKNNEATADEVRRIADFEHRLAKAQASEVIDLGFGYAVLQAEFPVSHAHNRIAVTSGAPAAEILSLTDEVLGSAGLGHRYISVDGPLADQVAGVFADAGYEHEKIASMVYRGPVPPPTGPDAVPVQAVTFEEVRPAIVRDWRIDFPDASDDAVRQLADRTVLYERGAAVDRLVVHGDGEVAARADLFLDGVDRIAQFENLVTHARYRGRGYGGALLREAARRASLAGSELFVLTADTNDWPYGWYRRFGFGDVTVSHHFTRHL